MLFLYLSFLVLLFILLSMLDFKHSAYMAEHDLWFMKKDFQNISMNIKSLTVKSVNDFINRCDYFINEYPGNALNPQVKNLMNNAITLKKSMLVQ